MTIKTHFKYQPFSFALAALFASLVFAQPAFAKERDLQNTQLQAFVRQLEQMQVMIADDLVRSPIKGERYYFDYSRFQEDLKRVQTGIEDYLVPKRAQPRDLVDILGNYQLEQTQHRGREND